MKLPHELPPESVTAIIDTREQTPLSLAPLRTIVDTLDCGDYSAVGMTHIVRIERKADDLISCCGSDRERFTAQMERLRAFPVRALVIEWTWAEIEMGGWRGKVTPASVRGTLLGIIEMGIPDITAGGHGRAGELVSRLIYLTAKRHYRTCRELLKAVAEERDA